MTGGSWRLPRRLPQINRGRPPRNDGGQGMLLRETVENITF
jgi:hypothetical protein